MYLLALPQMTRVYPLDVLKVIILRIHKDQGHLATRPLHKLLAASFSIDAPRSFVFFCIRDCRTCKLVSKRNKRVKISIPLPVEKGPFSRVQIDLIDLVGQPSSLGHTFIMVIIDCFTKYMWTYPLTSKSAEQSTFFINKWGIPGMLQTDNGSEFTNEDVTALLQDHEATLVHGRPQHYNHRARWKLPTRR